MTELAEVSDVVATRAELASALKKTKYHLVTSQILISVVLFLALKFIH